MKRCKVCGELKQLSDFYVAAGIRDGHRNDCKSCNLAAKKARTPPEVNRERVRRWQRENPEKYKAKQQQYVRSGQKAAWNRQSYLKRTYGITVEQYNEMLAAQRGVCVICKQARPENRTPHVDHDRATGEIRGLLCFRCNNALGDFEEQYELLQRAADYLDRDAELVARARERAALLRA